jgi:hypothetical protein
LLLAVRSACVLPLNAGTRAELVQVARRLLLLDS